MIIRRRYRSLGKVLQRFGRTRINHYMAVTNLASRAEVPPVWQDSTQEPLVWRSADSAAPALAATEPEPQPEFQESLPPARRTPRDLALIFELHNEKLTEEGYQMPPSPWAAPPAENSSPPPGPANTESRAAVQRQPQSTPPARPPAPPPAGSRRRGSAIVEVTPQPTAGEPPAAATADPSDTEAPGWETELSDDEDRPDLYEALVSEGIVKPASPPDLSSAEVFTPPARPARQVTSPDVQRAPQEPQDAPPASDPAPAPETPQRDSSAAPEAPRSAQNPAPPTPPSEPPVQRADTPAPPPAAFTPVEGSTEADMLDMLGLPPQTPVIGLRPPAAPADSPARADDSGPASPPPTSSPVSPSAPPAVQRSSEDNASLDNAGIDSANTASPPAASSAPTEQVRRVPDAASTPPQAPAQRPPTSSSAPTRPIPPVRHQPQVPDSATDNDPAPPAASQDDTPLPPAASVFASWFEVAETALDDAPQPPRSSTRTPPAGPATPPATPPVQRQPAPPQTRRDDSDPLEMEDTQPFTPSVPSSAGHTTESSNAPAAPPRDVMRQPGPPAATDSHPLPRQQQPPEHSARTGPDAPPASDSMPPVPSQAITPASTPAAPPGSIAYGIEGVDNPRSPAAPAPAIFRAKILEGKQEQWEGKLSSPEAPPPDSKIADSKTSGGSSGFSGKTSEIFPGKTDDTFSGKVDESPPISSDNGGMNDSSGGNVPQNEPTLSELSDWLADWNSSDSDSRSEMSVPDAVVTIPENEDAPDQPAAETTPAEDSQDAAASAPDIDRLARDVYSIIRDRLRIERERQSRR